MPKMHAGLKRVNGAQGRNRTTDTAIFKGREQRALYDRPMGPDTPGRALFMASERTERLGACLSAMTTTLNAVRPGEA